MFLNKLQST